MWNNRATILIKCLKCLSLILFIITRAPKGIQFSSVECSFNFLFFWPFYRRMLYSMICWNLPKCLKAKIVRLVLIKEDFGCWLRYCIFLSRISTICKHSLFTRVLAKVVILNFFKLYYCTSIDPKSASERGKHEHFI